MLDWQCGRNNSKIASARSCLAEQSKAKEVFDEGAGRSLCALKIRPT